MRSRTARVCFSALACSALGAAAFFLTNAEQSLAQRRAALRAFDLHARDAAALLSDARAGLHAYAAPGQSPSFWMPKVTTLLQESASGIDTLRELASTNMARETLIEVSASVTELRNVEKRARDYVDAGETLMASDVVFAEASEAAATAARRIENTRVEEHVAFDALEAGARMREAYVAGGAASLAALVLLLLAASPAPKRTASPLVVEDDAPTEGWSLREPLVETAVAPAPVNNGAAAAEAASASSLRSAADLCTAFGQLRDAAELKGLLSRAAYLIDATGIVVWVGSGRGADLQAVAAHGYSDDVLRRIKSIPRGADNAAAAAYRAGAQQIVAPTSTRALGAIVAPMLAPDGCVGAVTAEVRQGAESSVTAQSLVAILAAQLAGILAASTSQSATSPTARVASA